MKVRQYLIQNYTVPTQFQWSQVHNTHKDQEYNCQLYETTSKRTNLK